MSDLLRTKNISTKIGLRDNRRNDYLVRHAIDAIQNLLFDPQAPAKVFNILLGHIEALTGSDHSVCFLATAEGTGDIKTNAEQALVAIHGSASVAFIKENGFVNLIKQNAVSMRPTFYNDPIPNSFENLLISPERIQSLMVLPIVSHHHLRAVCILGKQSGTYSGDMVLRLMPVLGSVLCALDSTGKITDDILAFDKKVTDHRYLNSLLWSAPIAIIVVSSDNKVVIANPSAGEIFCSLEQVDQLINIDIESILPDFQSLFQWSNQKTPNGDDESPLGPQVWEDQTALRLDGKRFIANMTVFRYTHGVERFTTVQILDITAMRESADEYQQAAQQFNALTHLVPVGIIRVDAVWNCVYANDKWYEFSGLTQDETVKEKWINAIHSDDVKFLLDSLRESLKLCANFQKEIRLVSPLGQIRWVDFNSRVLFDDAGSVIGFLGTFQDVTERLIHEEKLRHLAEYDALTGLANRSVFQDRLEQAFYSSERDNDEVSVLFLDLDGFKDINDTLGHDIGDLLLKKVAERLLNTLRRNDTVARFGGDEFVILLGLNDHENVVTRVASKIIDTIAKPYLIDGHEVFVTISIGIASGTFTSSSSQQILKQADAALYLAKREGKNNFQIFSENLDNESQTRIKLANQLRYAISNERYHLVYQPIADINTQEVIGFEALLRFTDDDETVIGPTEFIPILEETGMMIEAGKWVIEEACQQFRKWQLSGHFHDHGFLSFNVSPKQLLDESIVKTIKDACEKYDVKPKYLVMEITETVIISKPQKVEKILAELKNIGISLAMDDFGTGYSSLSYLQKYPFDHIKVDRSFVANLLSDKNDAKITKAIISLAQSLGLKVTAEGVTTAGALSQLQQFGADHYQGYFLGKPMSAQETFKSIT